MQESGEITRIHWTLQAQVLEFFDYEYHHGLQGSAVTL